MKKQTIIILTIIILTVFLIISCSKNTPIETSPENIDPVCYINLPSDGSSFLIGSVVEIRVIANDEDGDIDKVKFYVDNQLIFEDGESPFQYYWDTSEETDGIKLIHATAIDDEDAMASDSVSVTIGWLYSQPEQIDDGWETASLENVNINGQRFNELIHSIGEEPIGEVHSILIIKDGKLVFEEYFPGYDFSYSNPNFHGEYINFERDTPHNTHSATKSIVSTLIGIAIDQGFINSVDDSLFSYFDSYQHLLNEDNSKITIEHLLTMTSGFEWNEWDVPPGDPNYDTYLFNTSSDPINYILSKPIVTEPGSSFYYNGAGVDLLGQLITNASGIRLNNFAGQYLFEPLSVTSYNFQIHPSGMVYAHGDIYLTPRSMAKYGYLLLNGGEWNGNQIVSEEWINTSITHHMQLPPIGWADGYGYLIWLQTFQYDIYTLNSISARGWGGQEIYIFPSLDMVAVFTGANYLYNPPCEYILQEYILPAVLN